MSQIINFNKKTKKNTKLSPDQLRNLNNYILQGYSLYDSEDLEKAKINFQQAAELSPDFNNLFRVGEICFQLKEYDSAVKYLERAYRKRITIRLTNLLPEEEKKSRKLLKNKIYEIICHYVGEIYKQQNNFAEALTWFRRNLEITQNFGDPSHMINSYNKIGFCYAENGQFPEAIDA